MKKLLFIIAILSVSFSYAQQEISNSQQDLSKKTSQRVEKFNTQLDAQVNSIMEVTKLDLKNRNELREIVGTSKMLLIRLDREGKSGDAYQARRTEIKRNYQQQLKKLLGTEKFNLLQSKVSPK